MDLEASLALNQARVNAAIKKPRPNYRFHQQKFGITFHFGWVLGYEWGVKDNFNNSPFLLRDLDKWKMFGHHPYLTTIGFEEKDGVKYPWVHHQLLPASLNGHRVNPVDFDIEVNPDGSRVKIWQGFFHCVDCQLMGIEDTFEQYHCR